MRVFNCNNLQYYKPSKGTKAREILDREVLNHASDIKKARYFIRSLDADRYALDTTVRTLQALCNDIKALK